MYIDDEWLVAYAKEIKMIGMPHCKFCDKRLRKGSYSDHHWPYYDTHGYHLSCRRKAKK